MFKARMNSKFRLFLLYCTFFHVKSSCKPPKTIWIVNNENTNKVSFEIRVHVNLKLCNNMNTGHVKRNMLYNINSVLQTQGFFLSYMVFGSYLFKTFNLTLKLAKIMRSHSFAKKLSHTSLLLYIECYIYNQSPENANSSLQLC